MTDPALRHLTELLRSAKRALVFTGAGVSTASNIPDFRGPHGLFRNSQPVDYQSFVRSEEARREYWSMKYEGYRAFSDAKPNAAHRSIAELERRGRVEAVVTQNVDGLHRAAGTTPERLIELHGSNLEVECIECQKREHPERSMSDFGRSRQAPRCLECGGLMKPAVVMFGQTLKPRDLERARAASQAADLVLSLGSSLVVYPAADIPLYAARRGVPYVIVNQGETPHDSIATLRIDADVSELLPAALTGW